MQRFKTNDMGDFIIRRQDGTSPFMYCNAIDDALMGVTHVVRGEDHLTNTPRQILILQALGLPIPVYGHISLIIGSDNSPLSKRNGSRSITQLREEGFLASALQNYMARLGHYYKDTQFLTLEELAQKFDFKNLNTSPAKYNEEQLLYWQKEAVLHLTQEAFATWVWPAVSDVVPAEKQSVFLDAIRANIIFPEQARRWAMTLFSNTLTFEEEHILVLKTAGYEFFEKAIEIWNGSSQDFKALTSELQSTFEVKGKALFQPLRVAMTGELHGPEFHLIVALLGKDFIAKRFTQAMQHCQAQGFSRHQ
jgi:glutamyl-tRNA synthetase